MRVERVPVPVPVASSIGPLWRCLARSLAGRVARGRYALAAQGTAHSPPWALAGLSTKRVAHPDGLRESSLAPSRPAPSPPLLPPGHPLARSPPRLVVLGLVLLLLRGALQHLAQGC